jgi:hypothetical protein
MAIELTDQGYLSDGAIFMGRKAKESIAIMLFFGEPLAPLCWQPLRKGTSQKCIFNRPTLPCPCLSSSPSVVIMDVSRAPDIFQQKAVSRRVQDVFDDWKRLMSAGPRRKRKDDHSIGRDRAALDCRPSFL